MSENIRELKDSFSEEVQRISNEIRMSIDEIVPENDEDIKRYIESFIFKNEKTKHLSHRQKHSLISGIFNSMRREMEFLQPYMEDDEVSEIMVNGRKDIFAEKKGKIMRIEGAFPSDEVLEEMIMRIAGKVQREINEMNPILDARLGDGSRVHAVYRNISLSGPVLTIRKFPKKSLTMDDMTELGTVTEEAAHFLRKIVEAGYNILISGGTSSGKSSLLGALTDYIPKGERLIVIEDSAELHITGLPNIVRLETKNSNSQGMGSVSMRDLIKASLRMRPDRILVGEVRGAEAADMITALNTGHDGGLSTIHANSAFAVFGRLEMMFLSAVSYPIESVRGQISTGIDFVVHLARLKDGSRRVLEISEFLGYEGSVPRLNCIFRFEHEKESKKVCKNEYEKEQQIEHGKEHQIEHGRERQMEHDKDHRMEHGKEHQMEYDKDHRMERENKLEESLSSEDEHKVRGGLKRTGNSLINTVKLEMRGISIEETKGNS